MRRDRRMGMRERRRGMREMRRRGRRRERKKGRGGDGDGGGDDRPSLCYQQGWCNGICVLIVCNVPVVV